MQLTAIPSSWDNWVQIGPQKPRMEVSQVLEGDFVDSFHTQPSQSWGLLSPGHGHGPKGTKLGVTLSRRL